MRADRQIAKRMREMLTHDKVGVKDGFYSLLRGDVNRILRDYFDLQNDAKIDIEQGDSGDYIVSISATATRIKQFDTTADLKRF